MFKEGQQLIAKGNDLDLGEIELVVSFNSYMPIPKHYPKRDGGETVLDCVVEVDGMKTLTTASELRTIN